MALLIVVDAAAAIQEQTIKRLFLLRISKEERVIRGLSSIFGAARKYGSGWIGQVILIGWKYSVTLTVKLNYAPNKKYKVLSAIDFNQSNYQLYLLLSHYLSLLLFNSLMLTFSFSFFFFLTISFFFLSLIWLSFFFSCFILYSFFVSFFFSFFVSFFLLFACLSHHLSPYSRCTSHTKYMSLTIQVPQDTLSRWFISLISFLKVIFFSLYVFSSFFSFLFLVTSFFTFKFFSYFGKTPKILFFECAASVNLFK